MKNFNRAIIILLTLALVLVSCKNSIPKIGFLLPHMNKAIKRYPVERDIFISKIKELGGEAIFMHADNDEAKQLEQVKELLKQDIDVLVLDPVNRFRAAEMVRAAHNKGIKVISYDRLIAHCDVDCFMSFDAAAIGSQMTQYALKLKPEGKYFILGGDKSDMNAVLIDEAIDKILSPAVKNGKISIVYKTFIETYSLAEARFEMERFFRLGQYYPDVILTSNDVLAQGAIEAAKDYAIEGKMIITGQGGEIIACKNILKGYQAMTIYKPVKKLAELAAVLSFKLAKGENVNKNFTTNMFNGTTKVPSILLDVISVDASNLKSTIMADGMVSNEELGE